MSLKAGYYGLRREAVAKLKKLVKIYGLGGMFNLSSVGNLSIKNATESQKGIVNLTDAVTEGSNAAVTSGAVYAAIHEEVSKWHSKPEDTE